MRDEKTLIKECLKQNQSAQTELYASFSGKMFGVCLRYAKNRMDAEDLLHEGFLKVLTNLKKYRGEGSFEGWMRRIMINTSINFYRTKTSNFMVHIDEVFDLEISDVDAVSRMSEKELVSHIQELPDGYRMIFNMYVVEGYKHKDIAEILNISESTSKTQLLKAKKSLQQKLKDNKH